VIGVQFPAAACVPAGVVEEVTVGEVPGAVVVVVAPVGIPELAPVLALVDGDSLVLAVVEVPVPAVLVPAVLLVPLELPVPLMPLLVEAVLVGAVPGGHGLVVVEVEVLPVVEVALAGTPGELVVEPCRVVDELWLGVDEFCIVDPVPVVPEDVFGEVVVGLVAEVALAGTPGWVAVVAPAGTPGVVVPLVPFWLGFWFGFDVVVGDVAVGELAVPVLPLGMVVCAAATPNASSTVPTINVERITISSRKRMMSFLMGCD
jgi:hypothetical protein